ncbi:MAG: EAL domain-containing protein [Hyphomicrobiaceae bacterium]|nr:EAL domain-containing protein [Hyphomicrobiaceae bacterium]MCC0023760.1 EAL domain-containing protein [Hyphomicrobiaceae bacterium]
MREAEKAGRMSAADIDAALTFVADASEGVIVFDSLDRLSFANDMAKDHFGTIALTSGRTLEEVLRTLFGDRSQRALIVFKRACRLYRRKDFCFRLELRGEPFHFRARMLQSGGFVLALAAPGLPSITRDRQNRQIDALRNVLQSLHGHVSLGAWQVDRFGQLHNLGPSVELAAARTSSEGSAPPLFDQALADLRNDVTGFGQIREFAQKAEDGTWHLFRLGRQDEGGFSVVHALQQGFVAGPMPSGTPGRIEQAVEEMALGFCIVGPDNRMQFCNRKFSELYEFSPEQVHAGMDLNDIAALDEMKAMQVVEENIPMSDLVGELGDYDTSISRTLKLRSGRFIAVQLQPMPGGGFVSTHLDITEQKASEERIRHMAGHDPLTDLPNRTNFSDHLSLAMARAHRGEHMALLCMDLDHFKMVNDTFGHAIGDQVLKEMASRIKTATRESEVAARMGGDEFTVLVGPIERPDHAAIVAQQLIDHINVPLTIDGHSIGIGVSIGIAIAPDDGATESELLRNADLALYRAKSEGRGVFHFFEPGMDRDIRQRRELEAAMREGIESEEFELVYQPLLDIESTRITGFETLIRWNHPTLGAIGPDKFIPIAEETGLIVPLGRWILQNACQAATNWPEHVRVTVNLSSAQFVEMELVNSVRSAVQESGIRPDRLELEITESLLLRDPERNIKILHQLRATGVRISMDDFGTGYTALSYLREFPFDRIKIDSGMIAEVKPESPSNRIVAAMIGLAGSLGMDMNAEGVENETQLDFVREYGCREAQGYLFSPPLPLNLATELLGTTEGKAAQIAGVKLIAG